jgi:hypothetical protein
MNVGIWPECEVAARLIEVRSLGHSGLDLLTLSSSHFDPNETLTAPNGDAPDAGFGLYQRTLFSC